MPPPRVRVDVHDNGVMIELPRQAGHHLALVLHRAGVFDDDTDWRYLSELRDRLDHALVRPPGAAWKVRRWEETET